MDAVTNEIAQEERVRNQQVRKDAELFNTMLNSEAWKRLILMVETVAQNYHANIMKPLDSSLEVTKMEYNKGVLSGLTLATALPSMKIKEAHDLARRAATEE